MPLKLNVSRGEKFIVNGAVIKNDGDGISLLFENQAQILRQKDILTWRVALSGACRPTPRLIGRPGNYCSLTTVMSRPI